MLNINFCYQNEPVNYKNIKSNLGKPNMKKTKLKVDGQSKKKIRRVRTRTSLTKRKRDQISGRVGMWHLWNSFGQIWYFGI